MKRVVLLLGTFLLVFIAYAALDQYLFCPDFSFQAPEPFSGENLYNPYQNKVMGTPSVANFHAHGKAWFGMTNGKGSARDIHSKYDSLGYSFHAVSQYHYIDTDLNKKSNYVPAYEHGLNIKKTHQLVIGAKHVEWKDYFFPQTLQNEQEILYQLAKDTSNLIVINHPSIRNAYPEDYLTKLQYYDYIELLNPSAQSIHHWDVILSSGKRVYAMGNDDLHNVFNLNQIGRFATFIFGDVSDKKTVVQTLRSGSAVAVWLPQCENETLLEKRIKTDRLTKIFSKINVDGNKIEVELAVPAREIKLITDHGKIKNLVTNTNKLQSQVNASETYWRTEILLYDGTRMFFNPITRTNYQHIASRNHMGSINLTRKENGPFKISAFFGIIVLIGSLGVKRRINKLKYSFRPTYNRSNLSN